MMSGYKIFKSKLATIKNRLSLKESDVSNCEPSYILSKAERRIFLSLILLFVVIVRIRLMDVPLERDEGEYAYMGQMLLQGVPPYEAAYSMKFPGTSMMYALIMALFGQTMQGIHLGLLVLNCMTVLVTFFLCRRIANDFAAIIASASYALLSLSPSVLGFAAHATHFVILPAVGGALVLLKAVEKNKPLLFFSSGCLFGLSLLMKQHGIFFAAFGIFYVVYHIVTSKPTHFFREYSLNISIFIFAEMLPLSITAVWLHTAGVFDKFWFWTLQYALTYGTQTSYSFAFYFFKQSLSQVLYGVYLFWIISALGFIVILFRRDLHSNRAFILSFSFFSFLSICPGFYFRWHYFITLLPAVSISIGIFIHYINTRSINFIKSSRIRFIGLGLFMAVTLISIMNLRNYLFRADPVKISRAVYDVNSFPESLKIAKFIEFGSNKADRVAIMGSEPQILFYSHRRSATGYIYTYPLMEHHDYAMTMQKEMAQEIEFANPKFVISVKINRSWLNLPNSNTFIFNWLGNFTKRNYHLVGVIDLISPDRTVYKWYEEAKQYTVQGANYILVFERSKDGL